MSIHSRNEDVILQFGLRKPAFRIVVNTPTTHGSIGLTTGLDPAMTLGCGGWGGNITSDNISPRHLLNIKRLAYEITPAVSRVEQPRTSAIESKAPSGAVGSSPPAPPSVGIGAAVLGRRIDEFLAARGFNARQAAQSPEPRSSAASAVPPLPPVAVEEPLDFVCEDDVRQAIQGGRKLVLAERAIVTPAARDLGEQHKVFSAAPWRG
jgi:acetaldehyde dehydrogenase (acetylating)